MGSRRSTNDRRRPSADAGILRAVRLLGVDTDRPRRAGRPYGPAGDQGRLGGAVTRRWGYCGVVACAEEQPIAS